MWGISPVSSAGTAGVSENQPVHKILCGIFLNKTFPVFCLFVFF